MHQLEGHYYFQIFPYFLNLVESLTVVLGLKLVDVLLDWNEFESFVIKMLKPGFHIIESSGKVLTTHLQCSYNTLALDLM